MIQGLIQIGLTLLLLIIIVPIFGNYMAKVYLRRKTILDPLLLPLERLIYALSGVRSQREMTGLQYARNVIFGNLVMGIFVFLILSFQAILPLNPTQLAAPNWDLALHTAIFFVTNTNQQHY